MKTGTAIFLATIALLLWMWSPLNAGEQNAYGSRTPAASPGVLEVSQPPIIFSPELYTYIDNFDGANDTTSLMARGYKVYRNTLFPGTTATWYQGVTVANSGPFNAYNGPDSGYVAANYNAVTGSNTIDNWLVLPAVNVAAGDELKFYARSPDASAYPDSIWVMYSAAGDSTLAGTYAMLGQFKVSTSGWAQYSFAAPSSGATARFVIRYHVTSGGPSGANSDYIGIDALTIGPPPTCPAPTTLTATGITTNSANLGWTETGSATSWDIEYGPTPFTPTGTPTNTGVTNPFPLGGLSPSTQYAFYVRANCGGGGYSTWSGPLNFTTSCGVVSSFPWGPTTFSGVFPPNCWTKYAGLLADPSVLTTTTSGWFKDNWRNTGVDSAARLNIWSTSTQYWLMTPQINLGGGSPVYQLEFDVTLNPYNLSGPPDLTGTDDKFAVVISTDGGTTWTSTNTLMLWDNAGSPNVYNNINYLGEHVVISLSGYTGVVMIGFYGESTVSNADNDLMIDNVVIQVPPTCPAPTALTASGITTTSANLGWTQSGGATSWDIEYGPTPFTPTGTPTNTGVTNPFPLTGLSPSTQYAYYVRANCGGGGYSTWAGPYNFTTACAAVTSFPWTEGFEGLTGVGSKILPPCWSYENVVGTSGPTSSNITGTYYGPNTGTNFVYTYYANTTWIFTPAMQLTGGVSYDFSFYMMNKYITSPIDFLMDVAYGTTNTSGGMTNALATGVVCNNSAYVQFKYTFTPAANGVYYFGVKSTSSTSTPWYLSFDDFGLEPTPSLVDASVTGITRPNLSETPGAVFAPQVTVTNNGVAPANVPVIAEIWTAEAVAKAFSVPANPKPVAEGIPIDARSLKGVKASHRPEYTFPELSPEAIILSQDFEGGVVPPAGWTLESLNPSYSWKSSTTLPHAGTYKTDVEYDPAPAAQDEKLITPVINLSSYIGSAIKLSFWWNCSYYWFVNPYNNATVSVEISTDGGTGWTSLWSEDGVGTFANWTWYNANMGTPLDLSSYAGQSNVKLRFHYVGNDGAQFNLDDILLYTEFLPVMVYRDSVYLAGVGTGSSVPATFTSWTANPPGNYLFKSYTKLGGDLVPGNDMMTRSVAVGAAISTTPIAGWNIISNPVSSPVPGDSVRQLFSQALFAYGFKFLPGSGYQQEYRLFNGVGYWEKFPASPSVVTFNGTQMPTLGIPVVAGWNLIGSISLPVDTAYVNANSVPSNIVTTAYYGFGTGGYGSGDAQLLPGRGYWVKTNAAGTLNLGTTGPALKPGDSRSTLTGLNEITIRDAAGHAQTLRFGVNADVSVEAYEMPPLPPAEAFDARFVGANAGYGVMVHDAENATLPVSVQSVSYPLTVEWNITSGSYELVDAAGNRTITGAGSMQITNPSVNQFTLRLGGSELPKEFALDQNYPNPFNPTTSIKFALPVESRVTVEVFNALGQRVRTLVNENRAAGYHVAEWNGTGSANQLLGSGVYFVRLDAQGVDGRSFTNLRKMVLLK